MSPVAEDSCDGAAPFLTEDQTVARRKADLGLFAAAGCSAEAWIPDTLRIAFTAHEVGNDGRDGVAPSLQSLRKRTA